MNGLTLLRPTVLGLAGGRRQRDRVVDDRAVDVDVGRHLLELGEAVGREDRQDLGRRPERALDDDRLLAGGRVADDDLHHEPVDLGLRQRVGALGLDRVLGRHDEERPGHDEALGADRDLALLHDLEQRALDLGRGAVDLVGEEEVREDRAELGVERVPVGAVDAGADEVGRARGPA